MLDKSIHWDRMSKGIKWPKMVLTYKDGSTEETDGNTYQYQHGLRLKGKRPIKIILLEETDEETISYLYSAIAPFGEVRLLDGREG